MVHEQLVKFYQGFRRDAHPMAVLVGVVGALSAFYHEAEDFSDREHQNISFNRIVAKLPTIVAMAYKYHRGEPFMYPRNDLDYTANFMHMMFATPCEEYKPNPVLVHALDTIFTLHADHEQNASTSTVRCRDHPAPIPTPASRPVSPVSGARRMAGRTKPACRCSRRSMMSRASASTSLAPRTRTTTSS
jgi:hypothetical protein